MLISFNCRGCGIKHQVRIGDAFWRFNGDRLKPTIMPSILVHGTIDPTDLEVSGKVFVPQDFVCHSYIKNGKIEYLSDCTHDLAGQTVDLDSVTFE